MGNTTDTNPTLHQLPGDLLAWGSQAVLDVASERRRQIEEEGWTPDRDDEMHDDGEIASAAASYALAAADVMRPYPQGDGGFEFEPPSMWLWGNKDWKPGNDPRRMLIKAGALILAEIERIDRKNALNSTLR